WNIVHFYIYKFENKVTQIISLPINWVAGLFLDIPYIKQGLERRGSSKDIILHQSNKSLNNSEFGMNVLFANIQMGGILVLLEYSIFNFIQGFLKQSYIQYAWENQVYLVLAILVFLVPPGVLNYYLLF